MSSKVHSLLKKFLQDIQLTQFVGIFSLSQQRLARKSAECSTTKLCQLKYNFKYKCTLIFIFLLTDLKLIPELSDA